MKFIIIIGLMLNFSAFAKNDLSTNESDSISNELDNICGDTWCEGDFNWNVTNLQCDFAIGTCHIDLTLIEDGETILDYYGVTPEEKHDQLSEYIEVDLEESYWGGPYRDVTYTSTCRIENANSYSDIGTEDLSYSDHLYYSVLECVDEIEDAYYRASNQP